MGDAAHTAHFSIGSGTRLAFDDAIALVKALAAHDDIPSALVAYDASRRPIAKKLVNAANTSATWYETFGSKMGMAPLDFGFDYLMRSGRMDMDRARQIAPRFMERYEAAKAAQEVTIVDPVADGVPGDVEIGFVRNLLVDPVGQPDAKSATDSRDRARRQNDLCRTRGGSGAVGQRFRRGGIAARRSYSLLP